MVTTKDTIQDTIQDLPLDRRCRRASANGTRAREQMDNHYHARTAFGHRLLELRKQIVASGRPLLDWDGVEREKCARGDILDVTDIVCYTDSEHATPDHTPRHLVPP